MYIYCIVVCVKQMEGLSCTYSILIRLNSKIGENRDESNKSAIKLWKTEASDSASLRRMARTKTATEKNRRQN